MGIELYAKEVSGKNGIPFIAYKIQTMYDHADEKLEEIVAAHGINGFGKPAHDPRIIPSRAWMRKYFIDELPQIYNVLKGEMSIVGIRPKSVAYWALEPQELQKEALCYRPGLFGVTYALGDLQNKTRKDIIEFQKQYLTEKKQHPFRTDIKYFFRIMYNILCKKSRSC